VLVKENGVEIPYPQHDVYIRSVPTPSPPEVPPEPTSGGGRREGEPTSE
jgi:small-conductance mechanosensitive channel